MQFEKVFIQKTGSKKLGNEEALVLAYLQERIPIVFYTEKDIHRRRLPLNSSTLIVGDIPCLFGAMKQLKIAIPFSNPYPKSLSRYLHRRIWQDTLGNLESKLLEGEIGPVFAKPKSQQKKITGRVFSSPDDLYFVYGATRRLELICSEIVEWLSEFRVYVVDSEIRKISHYNGDPAIFPSEHVLTSAVRELCAAGESYTGFGIDFGVLSSGETALIEMNDGFALGAYDVSAKDYGEMICKRWTELVSNRHDPRVSEVIAK